MEKTRVYLYLGRRDKRGVKVLTVLTGKPVSASRVKNVSDLNLPMNVQAELANLIHENRMEWEPWIESAGSYNELKENLRKRGYSQVPNHTPVLATTADLQNPHAVDHSSVPQKRVMVQKARKPV